MISNEGDLPNRTQDSEDNADENPKSIEESLLRTVREDIKKKIEKILEDVQLWSDTEKLLLYLKLPGSTHRDKSKDEKDPHAIPLSTTRAEQTQAFHWIRCHLEECENNSTLPKHEVYDEYRAHCESVNAVRVLSAPDFGKIIKCVFPNVKARRLGTRGNSKYCYSGIQKKRIVKSPQLPNLVAPVPGDKSMGNGGTSCPNGEKIGDDQTLVAACDLVCEWANKLLGRVFNTLVELGRFLVGGSYVSSKSMAAFVVMSSNEPLGSYKKLTLSNRKCNPDEQSLISQKRKQTQQQLQRKIQQRQQHKQQQAHQLNLLLHPSTPTGKQFTPILPQTQKGTHLALANGLLIQSKPQLQLSPKLTIVPNLQNPPMPSTPVIYNQTPQKSLGHLPPSTTLSPVTPSLASPGLLSPYNTKSPKRSAPHPPRSGTITPSPISTTPRHTPNGEVTRFVFTPITNGTADNKVSLPGGEASPPMLKRPTATHPGLSSEWNNHQNKSTVCLSTTPVKDTPGSPCKQPRIALKDPPSNTSDHQTNSFSQPMISPRVNKRPALNPASSMPVLTQNSNQARVPISPRAPRSNTSRQPVARQQSLPSSCSVSFQPQSIITQALSHQPRDLTSFPFGNTSTSDCRFQQTTATMTSTHDQSTPQNFLEHLPTEQELAALCNQLSNGAAGVQNNNRSHSVPPLPQNLLPRMNTSSIQPLTPQTDGRHQFVAPRMANANMTNTSGPVDGLKQLRNRVLHGDSNNNSGARNGANANALAGFAAKRNLMVELENVSTWGTSTSCTFQQNKPQILAELSGDPLAGLNLDEIAIEASSGDFDILVDESALFGDSNTYTTPWNASAQPVTLDSCL
ncbi:DNA-binding protein Rfx5-like [Dendronephthya gigantea]|uniref:DNA-binding protein Rfx5-like n=1 Tax=Dendronephthya gigantea TaxID=151771 RepID=UPI00106C7A0E|nr:DNA-binding protein Rfx5-like [Dendronephthya gigantea]